MYTMCVLKNQRVRRALSSFSVFVFVFSMLFGCFGGMQESIGDDFGPEKTILGKMKKENGVPSWYQPGDISVQPAMDTTKDTTNIIMKDLAHTRNFNEPFPDWVTHYKPINSRYLQLSSHNKKSRKMRGCFFRFMRHRKNILRMVNLQTVRIGICLLLSTIQRFRM